MENRPLFTCQTFATILLLGLVHVVSLHMMGQPAWGKYGFGLLAPAWSTNTSQDLFDPYTLTHVLHGVVIYWCMWPWSNKVRIHWRLALAIGIEVAWELLENSPIIIERYRDTASLDYNGDSILNSIGDVLAMSVGFVYARDFSWKASVALFLGLELLALYLARDNLTLNVIMLIHPFDFITQWQLARGT